MIWPITLPVGWYRSGAFAYYNCYNGAYSAVYERGEDRWHYVSYVLVPVSYRSDPVKREEASANPIMYNPLPCMKHAELAADSLITANRSIMIPYPAFDVDPIEQEMFLLGELRATRRDPNLPPIQRRWL